MDIIPTGKCWCGCGGKTNRGSFFLPGHDKKAERGLREILEAKDIVSFLDANGYGDGPGKKNLYDTWKKLPGNQNRSW